MQHSKLNTPPKLLQENHEDESILSDEEIEAILEAEGHLLPTDNIDVKPFSPIMNEPTQGRFGLVGVLLVAILAIMTISQTLSPLINN